MAGPDLGILLWTVGGVVAAVVLPILAATVRRDFPAQIVPGMPPWLRKYLTLLVFSVIAAVVSLAAWMAAAPDPKPEIAWYTAFLIGFGWEAAIEKLTRL
ncbi:MAG: hypothetical protein H7Y20_00735 [Bryobacteraceae bacterium]|nr:hypothetical protein [Bryobacteraceae bacterium]